MTIELEDCLSFEVVLSMTMADAKPADIEEKIYNLNKKVSCDVAFENVKWRMRAVRRMLRARFPNEEASRRLGSGLKPWHRKRRGIEKFYQSGYYKRAR